SQIVQDFYNRRAEKAIASFDFPHVVKLTWIYELPFGRGRKWLNKGGGLDRLVSGWQFTAIQNYSSGVPLVIFDDSLTPGIQMNAIRAALVPAAQKPFQTHGLNRPNEPQFLNPPPSTDPPLSPINAVPLRPGNSPGFLPQTRGPGHSNEDFGIIKNTHI